MASRLETPGLCLAASEGELPDSSRQTLWIEELPEEVLTSIARYATRCEQNEKALGVAKVSDKLCTAVLSALDWKLDLNTVGCLDWVPYFDNNAREVDLATFKSSDKIDLTTILTSSNLQAVRIDESSALMPVLLGTCTLQKLYVRIQQQDHHILTKVCALNNLRHLFMYCGSACTCRHSTKCLLAKPSATFLPSCCPGLESLQLDSQCIGPSGVAVLISKLQHLQGISLNIDFSTDDAFSEQHLAIFRAVPIVELRNIGWLRQIQPNEVALPLRAFVTRMLGLVNNTEDLHRIVQQYPNIEHLDIVISVMEPSAVDSLPSAIAKMTQLRGLTFSSFSKTYKPPDGFVVDIARSAPQLALFGLLTMPLSMPELPEALGYLSTLDSFVFSYNSDDDNTRELYISVLQALVIHCHRLQRVIVNSKGHTETDQPEPQNSQEGVEKIQFLTRVLRRRNPLFRFKVV